MSASETVTIINSAGTTEWLEIGEASHNVVQFHTGSSNVTQVYVGDDTPAADGIPVSDQDLVRIEHANTKVWAKILAGRSITVVRGDAKVSPNVT